MEKQILRSDKMNRELPKLSQYMTAINPIGQRSNKAI